MCDNDAAHGREGPLARETMTQTLPLIASLLLCVSALLLCGALLRRPALALAGHSFSRGAPPGGRHGRDARQSHAQTASAPGPSEPSRSGLSDYPDRPLDETPRAPVAPRFVVEHRTALKGREVTVRGLVVASMPAPHAGVRPRFFMAETSEPGRDNNYDLMVMLAEDDEGHAVGEEVEVRGTVESSKVAVYLSKSY